MNPHLKLAYEYGVQQAIKEAMAVWGFPTFKSWLGIAPEMAHNVGMGVKDVAKLKAALPGAAKQQVTKVPSRVPVVFTAEQQAARAAANAHNERLLAEARRNLAMSKQVPITARQPVLQS